jgi:hypothetical protein
MTISLGPGSGCRGREATPAAPARLALATRAPDPATCRGAAPASIVKHVLITGMSGTGKSSVVEALTARGYKAVDADWFHSRFDQIVVLSA